MKIYTVSIKNALKAVKVGAILLIMILALTFILHIANKSFDSVSASADVGTVIIIDAGHGGEDSGAIGINGVYEKDLNLALAMNIGDELKSKGYTVVYTRTEDKMLYLPEENIKGMRKISDLKNRCSITKDYDNCIFVSIHMNSYGSSKYSGLQVYYSDRNDESRHLAAKIQNTVKNTLQPQNNRQIKNGKNLYLLEKSNGTAVLVECGFLSNSDECEKLSEKEYQKELSFSIVCGIIEYINERDGAS